MAVPITPPCNTGAFIERLGGDAELARQMARVFLAQIDRLTAAVHAALAAADPEALRTAAHAVKGSAANFDAAPTVAVAAAIEQHGRSGDIAAAAGLIDTLDLEVARLVTALREFGGSQTCAS
ncbi:MAG TPA: Hpt domain-containing protein [Vicinamibacterales bacterium]